MDDLAGGLALGSAALGLAGNAGLFGNPKQYGFSNGDINAAVGVRQGQINDFSNQLAAMRAQYMAQIPGLNQAAFNQFGNNAAASFGAKGLTTNGGAFQSALAKEAIPLQAKMDQFAYTSGVANAGAVNGAESGLFNGQIGALSAGLSAPSRNPAWAGLGKLAGTAASMAVAPNNPNPMTNYLPGMPGYNGGSAGPSAAPAAQPQGTMGAGMLAYSGYQPPANQAIMDALSPNFGQGPQVNLFPLYGN